jgi:protein SCO1/2
VEAAEGKIGSSINRLTYITGCYLYDKTSGKYTPQAVGIMRIGGAATALALVFALVPYWFFGRGGNMAEVENAVGPVVANSNHSVSLVKES